MAWESVTSQEPERGLRICHTSGTSMLSQNQPPTPLPGISMCPRNQSHLRNLFVAQESVTPQELVCELRVGEWFHKSQIFCCVSQVKFYSAKILPQTSNNVRKQPLISVNHFETKRPTASNYCISSLRQR